jgi:tetratricopeptide (TPR) repeat protein
MTVDHQRRRSVRSSAYKVLWCILASFSFLLVSAPPVRAQPLSAAAQMLGIDLPSRRHSFTAGELARLPPYCPFQQGSDRLESPEGRYWQAVLGEGLSHIHHYCRGMRDVQFARSGLLTPKQREILWQRAISEFVYMINTNPPTMPLMPEIFLRHGEALLELGRVAEAQEAFQRSRQIKPDYWPAYTMWADFLARSGRHADARALLEAALVESPDQSELTRRLAALPPQR